MDELDIYSERLPPKQLIEEVQPQVDFSTEREPVPPPPLDLVSSEEFQDPDGIF